MSEEEYKPMSVVQAEVDMANKLSEASMSNARSGGEQPKSNRKDRPGPDFTQTTNMGEIAFSPSGEPIDPDLARQINKILVDSGQEQMADPMKKPSAPERPASKMSKEGQWAKSNNTGPATQVIPGNSY